MPTLGITALIARQAEVACRRGRAVHETVRTPDQQDKAGYDFEKIAKHVIGGLDPYFREVSLPIA